ncbi:dihydrofolate reductase type 2 [Stenotrophomonas phage StenR_269]|nr:dihydrofolate reductase type 2 [Stenotrophomonas phage StenR_269]
MKTIFKEGDVVVLKSGGRHWTLDSILLNTERPYEVYRLVTMSEGGKMEELFVKPSSVNHI